MQLTISRSKNSESFYITKSFRDPKTRKTTSKVVEKLGTRAQLQEKLGARADVEAWARARAAELTLAEKQGARRVMVPYDPTSRIEPNARHVFGGGYLFLQAVCASLGLEGICERISARAGFDYDLHSILTRLVYGRILEPASKRATCAFAENLIEPPDFEAHQVYRALEVLARESDFIQAELYKNSKAAAGRKTGILYYDCTNYFFEIECEDDFRRYGMSKEHRPNPIVGMGLFMDAEGMPLAFCMNPGNESEQPTMCPLEQKIIDDFAVSKFVACTDAGLSSLANRRFNAQGERQFITTQSVKKLKGHLKTWVLDTSGWSARGMGGTFDLASVAKAYDGEDADEKTRALLASKTFYKSRRIKEKDGESEGGFFEQELIITFSFKHRDYQRRIRDAQIERAAKAIEHDPSRMERKGSNDFRRLCRKTSITAEGEVAAEDVWSIDADKVAAEARYDGFYALATSLADDDVESILAVNARRWEIEECFRIMKTEFKARPVYLSREDRIRAHFLTCFIALLVYRIAEKKLKGEYTCEQIVDTLRGMDFERVRGEGYRPLYMRTDITDALHDAFGFHTDYEILTDATMKKIIKQTKKG